MAADDIIYHIPAASGDAGEGVSAKAYSVNFINALYGRQGAWKHVLNFTEDVRAFGESVTMPIVARQVAEDIDPATGAIATSATLADPGTILINKQKGIRHVVASNTLRYQGKVDVSAMLGMAQADGLNAAMDIELEKLIPGITNSAGTLGSDLTEEALRAAQQKLAENFVSFDNPDDFVFVLPTSQFAVVNKLTGSYATNYRIVQGLGSDGNVKDIQVQTNSLFGIPVFWKADSALTVSGGAVGGLFYKDSVGIAIQRTPSLEVPVRVPGTYNYEFLSWSLFGIKALKPAVACKILTK